MLTNALLNVIIKLLQFMKGFLVLMSFMQIKFFGGEKMIYNSDSYSVECSGYELCMRTQRPCNLDSYISFSVPLNDPDGQMYYRIQSEAGAYYNPNVELSSTLSIDGVYFTVTAVADGIIRHSGYCVVDKIKTVSGRAFFAPPDAVTEALLKLSAYFLCLRDSLDSVKARITYYNVDSKKIKYFNYRYSKAELEAFYLSMIEKIKYRVLLTAKRAQERLDAADARFPYGELREGQEIMIREIHSAIKREKRIFVEAPTGTGKTISALFPAVRAFGEGYCDKIFYLTPKTSTRREAFSAMAKLFEGGTKLRTVVITAKEQICPCAKGIMGQKKIDCSSDSCPYSKGYYDRVDGALYEMTENYTGYSARLISETAKKYGVCPYELSLDLSELCDVVICDYNYAFDPIVYFRRYFGADAEKGRYLFLVDEAHDLAERAREMYSAELSVLDFRVLLEKIDPIDVIKDEVAGLLQDPIASFRYVKKLCKDTLVRDENGEKGFYINTEPYEKICAVLDVFVKKAKTFLKKNSEHYLCEDMSALLLKVKKYLKITELFDEGFRFYAWIDGEDISVKCYCLDPSGIFKSLLLRASSSVFFSATLTPPEYFRDILGGGENSKAISLPSPFDPQNLCVAVADYVNTRFEDREDNVKKFVNLIAASVTSKAGNYIAYFPSYKCLEDVYKAFVRKYPKVETVVQKKNMNVKEREEFLSAFKNDAGHLRVGFCVLGGVFSEGVDLPGSRLIGSIIFGVGLSSITNEKNIIRDYYDGRSEEVCGYDYAYTYPGMNNVLQAAGRVIRRSEDRGIVVLADDRYATPKYRALFPSHWQGIKYAGNASSVAEIMRRFWENHS